MTLLSALDTSPFTAASEELRRVRLPRALVGENLLVKLAELAEVERAGVVRVVILHQRELVVRECVRIDVDPDLLEHVVELGNLQAAASVRIELLECGLHPQHSSCSLRACLPRCIACILTAAASSDISKVSVTSGAPSASDIAAGWNASLARSGLGLSCSP